MHRLLFCLVTGFATVSCGGKDSGADATPFQFDDLTTEEKFAYMASDVVPTMAPIFQGHDAEAHADFGCGTCHVQGMADGTYAMPDPGLPPLEEDAFPYTSDVGVFMEEEVRATMAELLGPREGGHPCTTCHTLTE